MAKMKYNVNWKGLDQGVEHTWTPEVLITGLQLIKKHQPVEHRDPLSRFYDDMEEVFPDKKWRAFDSKDNSFRPIFRRSNTWKKLGLITEYDKEFSISLIGKQLLNGEIKLNDIYSNICVNHIEEDEKPFIILAMLLLRLDSSTITPDDALFLLSNWRPVDSKTIKEIRAETPSFSKEITSNDSYKTRRRRVASMLKLFVSMGALQKEKQEFKIVDRELLLQIASESESFSFKDKVIANDALQAKKSSKPVGNKKIVSGERKMPEFSYLAAKSHNPLERLMLLERATRLHEQIVEFTAKTIKDEYNFDCFENPFGYDLFAEITVNSGVLIEVKTITPKNISKQIREAVSQLHEYNFKYKSETSKNNSLVIVLDQNPLTMIEEWVLDYLANDRNISLWWVENGAIQSAPLSKTPRCIFNH